MAKTQSTKPEKATRTATLIALLRREAGATAQELGAAVGWQKHSVRGFIAGTVKKKMQLAVEVNRADGVTRYRIVDVDGACA